MDLIYFISLRLITIFPRCLTNRQLAMNKRQRITEISSSNYHNVYEKSRKKFPAQLNNTHINSISNGLWKILKSNQH